jgi:hypothetical protein
MDQPMRRAWSKPELVVLVRSGPQEAVLQTCKGGAQDGVNASTDACLGRLEPCLSAAPS